MRNGIEYNKAVSEINWIIRNTRPFLPGMALIIGLGGLSSLSGVALAIASKNTVDNAIAGNLRMAVLYAAVFIGTIIISQGANVGLSLLSVRISESMSNSMRQGLYNGLATTEWIALSAYHSGDFLTRLTSDVSNIVNMMVNIIPAIMALVLQLTAAFITLLFYDPRLAILAFLLGPLTLAFSRIWGRKLKYLHIEVQRSESKYRSYIQEVLQNILIIKCFGLGKYSQDNLQGLHQDRMQWILRRNRVTLGANTVLGMGFSTGYCLAFIWGAYRLSQKAISFGTLTAFLQLVNQVQGPFIGLSRNYPQIIAALASADRLIELEVLKKEKSLDILPGRKYIGITFRKVSFSYCFKQPVLHNISFEIQPGDIVALVGSTGMGKTTIARLILALLRPSAGEVFFTDRSGIEYEGSAATRDWVSYVPQGNMLFSGTIADNLRNGKHNATTEEMMHVLRTACMGDFIKKLPQGLETLIGEGGLGLSEGQAQRIAIARALLKNAPILIMDEATSALDVATEAQLFNAIKRLEYCNTCIIITHRPSALKICSRVMKIENGSLLESKRTEDLIKQYQAGVDSVC